MTASDVEDRSARSSAEPLLAWALALFDGAAAAHRLPGAARRLLLLAAECYAAAGDGDADQVARRARDLALAAPIEGLAADQQAIAAGVAGLQREKARPRREPALLRLDARDQKVATRLAAILRVARALGAEPPRGLLAHVDGDATTLAIGGARAAQVAQAADGSADLWRDSIGPLAIRPAEPGEALAPPEAGVDGYTRLSLPSAAAPDQLAGGEPIAEGARRVLRRFFGRMLAREDAVSKDDDPEDVHQMRVASRRLRAALQIVEGIYDADDIRRYRRGLRRVAQALADVRDLDVFRGHVLGYLAGLPEDARADIAPLVAAVEAQRDQASAALVGDLDRRR